MIIEILIKNRFYFYAIILQYISFKSYILNIFNLYDSNFIFIKIFYIFMI